MLNFMRLRDYPLDISDFNHDMSNIVDRIYVGPQGELLEHLERFNQQYNTELEVTKQFTLKPGGYDSIKAAYGRWVDAIFNISSVAAISKFSGIFIPLLNLAISFSEMCRRSSRK